ncbi:MAG: S41 family peptidase [Cellulosilyticaceae bacterium]
MKKKICAVVVISMLALALLGGAGYTLSQPIQFLPIEEPQFESHRALDEGLRVQEMEDDLKALSDVLYAVHPKVVEEDHAWLDQAFEEAYSKVKEPLLLRDFYYMVSELLAKFQDAHTSTFPKDLGESYMQADLKWIESDLYVINSRFLKPKDRIVAINSMPIEEIYEKAHKIISAENEYARRSRFIIRIKTLSFIETCTGERRVERITVEREGKMIEQPIIYGMSPYTNRKIQEEDSKNWVRYEIDPERETSIFTLKTCDYNEEYQEVVRKMFEEMKAKDVKHLIIDVRGNGGGNSKVIDEIIHYLPVDRYVYYGVNARYSEAARLQRGYLRTSGTVSYSPGKKMNKKVEDFLFDGDIYILVDDHTFSSANWMGVIFQDSHLGTVVGEPTSNNPNSYGDVLQFQLPNSQIRYQVSMKRWVRPDQSKNNEDTLMPDVLVKPTLDEWVSGRDIILERTIELIKIKKPQ